MSSLVTLDCLAAQTPDGRPLFENLTLTFGTERTGLVGRNGVGKTTLLQIIAGERAPSAGVLTAPGRVGLLRQTVQVEPGVHVESLLGLGEPLARLRRIADGRGTGEDLDAADWGLQARLGLALAQVGLPDLDLGRPAVSLSGGQVTRVALAGLLARAPDLLILDEPTNNLDAEARGLLAEVIERWPGGAIIVSHDRDVLRRMDRIVELSGLGARVYGGNYDSYLERKTMEEAAAGRELADAERLQVRVAREAQLAAERKARRDATGRRHSAKGTEPKIFLGAQAERAEVSGAREGRVAQRLRAEAAGDLAAAQAKVERLRKLGFELPRSGLAAGKTVLAIEDVTFAHPGEMPILRDVSLKMVGPERIAVSGPNGAGKTTLIRLAAGELAPNAGRVARSAPTAFLDQQTTMLRSDESLVTAFRRLNPTASENQARAALARFLFRNVAADKCVGALSGGERLRAALACVLMADRPPQLLILDEPTNHLDLDSIGAVEAALGGYDGALLVVSHDRDFLAAIGIERDVVFG